MHRSHRLHVAALTLALATGIAPADADDAPRLDCRDPQSTYEINACLDRDFTRADADLNRIYKKALAAIPEHAVADDKRYDRGAWETALRESQRAWLQFRDAECKNHVAMFWTGGTGATAAILGCMTEKTEARTKELKSNYDLR